MESLVCLFDPADSIPGPRRERRRGRKNRQNKNDIENEAKKPQHVPEESSFLCEPQFSADVLATDVDYLDSYMLKEDENGNAQQKKHVEKKRRSVGRKGRRKKKSPPKEHAPPPCWSKDKLFYPEQYECGEGSDSRRGEEEKEVWWNNSRTERASVEKARVGCHVNNLQRRNVETEPDYNTKCKRRTEPFDLAQIDSDLESWPEPDLRDERRTNPILQTIEKTTLQDDMYLAGEWSSDQLETDFLYKSDEDDDDESSSETEDSGDETYGSLPPEPQHGNVEYKLQLVRVSEKRFQHLVTQLKWRLRSGGGCAVYVLGVRDCGALRGLRARPLRASLRTLRNMAATLRAELRHVTTKQLATNRAVAQVYVRKLADTTQSVEMRVAVMGANEAGKSTLIGVLTQGELDNGRGSARLNMFRHLHEVRSGRTSSLSHEILGFDKQGNVVNYGCSELMTAERIGERSAKLVSFLDLAGHSKYQRTTVHGLTGYCPHFAMLVVSATAGISRMTEEHLGLVLALDLPFFVVVTRTDLAPAKVHTLVARIRECFSNSGCTLRPKLICNEAEARTCAAAAEIPALQLDSLLSTSAQDHHASTAQDKGSETVPVFPVSCVTGQGLNALHSYLLALQPPAQPVADDRHPEEDTTEFQIDEVFRVGESCGPVVGGLLATGELCEGDNMLIGPLDTGDFVPITVKTIYRNRVACGRVRAGQSASLGLSHRPAALRQGMTLIAVPHMYKPSNITTGGLIQSQDDVLVNDFEKPDKCTDDNGNISENSKNYYIKRDTKLKDKLQNIDDQSENSENISNDGNTDLDRRRANAVKDLQKYDVKSAKRKNRNVLQDVENNLAKENKDMEGNLYTLQSELCVKEDKPENLTDELLLEDPNNPRGCLYFQATVRVLRHTTTEIYAGFQATVHIGNIRQTAVIVGILSQAGELVAGRTSSVVFRFVRQPEYVRAGRRLLFRAGLETCGVGRVSQVFPMEPAH